MIVTISILLVTFGIAYCATYAIFKFALRYQWLDIPNTHSSHEQPTPREAGIAIITAFVIKIILLTALAGASLLGWHTELGYLLILLATRACPQLSQ